MIQKIKAWVYENRGRVLGIIGLIIGWLMQAQLFIERNFPEAPIVDTVVVVDTVVIDTAAAK